MSKKNLLNESTIRKFMKLASIEPLAGDFLGRIQEAEAEEELEEGHGNKPHDEDKVEEAQEEDMDEANCGNRDDKMEEELDIDEMGGDMMYKDDEDMDMGIEEPEGEMEMDMGDESGADKMLNMSDFLDVLERAVEEFLGEPTEIERDEEPAGDEELDMLPADDELADAGEDLADAGEDLGLDADSEEDEEEDLAESIYKEVLKKLSKKK